jgi:hypothetical protein
VGRPDTAALFFKRLHGALSKPSAGLLAADPAAVARAAALEALAEASAMARDRLDELWGAVFHGRSRDAGVRRAGRRAACCGTGGRRRTAGGQHPRVSSVCAGIR